MNTDESEIDRDGTYEAIGPHFQGNPYNLAEDRLIRHWKITVELKDRTFNGVREFLRKLNAEGLVFWLNGEPVCKIKRNDFGFAWPITEEIEYEDGGLYEGDFI